ncbi:hypothetical protein EVAR_86106_1 [Eumeta japonica]|uniref:Uncharacterized protein n=1 Tax=Eumeta variegata TaxID=151549 RepID=A0A4C1V2G3_EUMVA|nr:hypothetical protein EVAR_86106_1 [Eumeta japonica]
MWHYQVSSKLSGNSVPTSLEVLSFNAILMKIWKSSNLPNQILIAMNRQTMSNDEFRSSRDLTIQHLQMLEKVQTQIRSLVELPKFWKNKIAVALQKLNVEVLYWAKILVMNLTEATWDNIMCCYENIIISQEGVVERRKTIVNILQESKFKVKFTSEFLSCYCIERKMVNLVYRNVLYQISNRERCSRKRRHNGFPSCLEDMDEIKRQVLSTQDVRKYWLLDWIKARQCPSKMYWRCNLIQYAATKQCVEIMQYFYNIMDEPDRQEHLFKAFKFVIKNDLATSELVIFFYEHLEAELWNIVLERNFHLIFYKIIKCWRYRSLAVRFFNDVKCYMNVESYRLMLNIFKVSCTSEYNYYDLVHIIRSIWMETPIHLRRHPRIAHYSIPELVSINSDFYLLLDLIRDYEPHEKIEVISQVIYCIVAEDQIHLVDKCLNVLNENGITITSFEDLINKNALKQFILNSLNRSNFHFHTYKTIREYFTEKMGTHITEFEDVFKDRSFVVKFVTYLCRIHMDWYNFEELMRWCYCSESMLRYLKKKIVSEKWILEVYERFLLDPKARMFLYKPIIYFDLKQEVNGIKQEIINTPKLMNSVLTNLLKQRKCDHLFSYLHFLYVDLAQHKNCLEQFLLSEEGVKAVMEHLVMYLENAESELSLRFSLETTLDLYSDFNDCWLRPYNLEHPFDNKLVQYGHPNLKPQTLKIKSCFELKASEIKEARRIVDAKYRYLRAIINGNFSRDFYRSVSKAWDLTEKSIAMATESGIYVATHM